jgi:tape measure domain-containing protein
MTRIAEAAIVFSAVTGPLKKQTQDAVKYINDVDKASAKIGRNGGVDKIGQQLAGHNKSLRQNHALAANLRMQHRGHNTDDRNGSGSSFLGNVTKGAVGGLTFGLGLAGIEGAASLGGMVAEAVDLAGQFERTTLSFETMLGSADKAKQLLGNIKNFAAESPLTLTQAADAGKQLLAYGIAVDQVVPTLRALTDVASGTGVELGRLTLAYGQVATSGRLYGTELRQFTEAGVPVIDALAVALNKPKESIKGLVEDGKVGFNDLIRSFKILTEDGGKFSGMTEKYAGSLNGQIDRLKDSIETLKREVGTAIIEETGLKDATADMTAFTDRLREGVNSMRPLIRMGGHAIKAGAQLANEFGKFMGIVAEARLEKLTQSLPFLRDLQDSFTRLLKDAQEFRIDPVAAGDFAISLVNAGMDMLSVIENGFVSIGTNAKKDLVDPIIDAAMSIKAIVEDIRAVIQDIDKANIEAKKANIEAKRGLATAVIRLSGQGTGLRPVDSESGGVVSGEGGDFGERAVETAAQPKPLDPLRAAILPRMADMAKRQKERDYQRDLAAVGGSRQEQFMGAFGPAMAGLSLQAKDASKSLTALKEVANVIPARLIEGAEKLNKEFGPRFDPLGKFVRDFGDLQFMRNRSLISPEVKSLGAANLFKDLSATLGALGESRLPQLLEAGSKEASRLEMSAITAGNSGSVLSVLRAIQAAAEDEVRQSRRTDEAIQRALDELGIKVELPKQ